MGLIVSRWPSMLSFTAVLILITASGCKMSSWNMPGMGWLTGGSNETTTQASPNQPAASSQAVPSANASKYLNPPTISTGTPSNFGDATATTSKTYPNGRTTAYNGRNTIGPYHPPKSKTVATTQPPAAVSNPQYGSNPGYPRTQYPTAQIPAAQYPATQYPATQYPTAQYPTAQYPTAQYPTAQYPTAQYPATQYPAAQYPAAQYPAAQYPAAQYPTTTPNAGPAYPAKTADARNTTYGTKPADGNYQRGFYAPERPPAGTFQTQPAPAKQAPTYPNPQPGSFGQGAASSYSPGAPAQISTKLDFALPVTPGSAAKTAQSAPYGTDTDPYASKAQSPGAPAAQYPTQSSPAPYRPGSTGRLDPTSVPQQQESFPTRSSQFNAYGN
jgi:hypothetical protein